MTARSERIGAVATAAFVVIVTVVGLVALPVLNIEETIPTRILAVAFGVIGAMAVRTHEGRIIGWLFLAIAVSSALLDTAHSYAELWKEDPAGVPLGAWAKLTEDLMGQVSSALMFVFLPLLFPTGRAASPFWNRVVRLAWFVAVFSWLAVLVAPMNYENRDEVVVGANPLGVGDAALMELISTVAALTLLMVAAVAVVGFVLRYRRAAGTERLQLRWLATGFGAALLSLLTLFVVAGLARLTDGRLEVPEVVLDLMMSTAVLFIPFGAGIAVTRYRLYEIDRVITRSATYAAVVVVLAAVYVGAVLGFGALAQAAFGDESNDLVVALSTLLVAAAFQPVRTRVRAVVDRRFNRRRYDAGQEVERFGGRLRDSLALEDVVGETVAVAGRTVQPAGASLWLRQEATS